MMKKTALLALLVLAALPGLGQSSYQTKKTIYNSGDAASIANYGGTTGAFTYTFTGAPASSTVTISGCFTAGICDTPVLDSYAGNANTTRNVSTAKVYDYFSVLATWTGGSGVSIAVSATTHDAVPVATLGPWDPTTYNDCAEIAAPGAPAAGRERLYCKAAAGICAKDSSGTERCTGSGGGAGTVTNSNTLTAAHCVVGDGANIVKVDGACSITAGVITTNGFVGPVTGDVTGNVNGSASLNLLKSSNLSDVANASTARANLSAQAQLGAAPTTVSMGGVNGTKVPVYVNTTPPVNLSKLYYDGTDWQTAPSSIAPNAQAGDYAILGMDNATPDLGKVITSSKATAAAWTISRAGVVTSNSIVGFPSGFFFFNKNLGVGTETLTATTSKFLINNTTGSSTQALLTNGWCLFGDNGADYISMCSPGLDAAGQIPAAVIPNTAVTPAAYTNANITVGADGRVTAAANGSASAIPEMVFTSLGSISQGNTRYLAVGNTGTAQGTELNADTPVSGSRTYSNLTCYSRDTPAAGQTFTFTLDINNSASTATCQITSSCTAGPVASSCTCTDGTHSPAGTNIHLVSLNVTTSATSGTLGTNGAYGCSVKYQ